MDQRRISERIGYDLDWNLLRTFMVIVQTGGITSASERLHVTQPTVSLALKRLEDRLGYRLIDRGHGAFNITQNGEFLYNEVVSIFASVSRLGALIGDSQEGLYGHIRILIASRIEPPLLDQALYEFRRKNRMVTFSIEVMSSHDILLAIQNRVAAIGICVLPRMVKSIKSEVILKQRYRFYCGRKSRLFGISGLSLADLRDEDFVSFTSDQFEGALSPLAMFRAQEGFTGRIIGTSANVGEVRRMIRAGMGIGPLAEHLAQPDVEKGILWPLPPPAGVGTIDGHLIWSAAVRLSRAEQGFLDELLATIRQVPEKQRLPADGTSSP